MTENNRFGQIREAVKKAKDLGLERKLRREAIINATSAQKKGIISISEEEAVNFPSVGLVDIDQEDKEVINTAINKYLEVTPRNTNVLVEAIHAVKPPKIFNSPDEWDKNTGELAIKIADLSNTSLIIAKKSRMNADLNRAWWTNEERKGKESHEYPRSARAALYWAVKKILSLGNRLDDNNQLKDNFYRISLHGMKNNSNFDFAIAGSERPADPEFLEWFKNKFEESLEKNGIIPRVVIAQADDKMTALYSGPSSIRYFRETPKKDYLIQHPAFGNKFQTVQLEIANHIRTTPELFDKTAIALADIIEELKNGQY